MLVPIERTKFNNNFLHRKKIEEEEIYLVTELIWRPLFYPSRAYLGRSIKEGNGFIKMCNGIAEITSPLPSKKYGIEWKLERERSSRGKERNRPRGAVHFTVLDSKASFYQAGHKSNRGEIWGGGGISWNDRAERNCWIHCLLRVLYVLRRLLISPSFIIPFSWQRKGATNGR